MKISKFSGLSLSMFGGLYLILLYCGLATGADAITRTVAQSFEAPQLFCFSGGLIALLSLISNRFGPAKGSLKTKRPYSLALRSVFFVLSSVFYFFAFRSLPFAEVFVFIALVPIFTALLSGPILGEAVRWQTWLALLAGVGGMILLHPEGLVAQTWAHLSALLGAMTGACAMVLARHISRDEKNALVQIFYPNLAMFLVMACALPFVCRSMTLTDAALIGSYASLLFLARWVLVLALTRIKAYVVTLLMNLQFVVMVIVGIVVFGEVPSANLFAGVGVIVLASSYIYLEQILGFTIKAKTERLASLRKRGQISDLEPMRAHGIGSGLLSFTLKS